VILDPLDPWAWSESVTRWGPSYTTALVENGLAEEAAARRSLVALSLDATRTSMAGGRTALAALMQAEPRRVTVGKDRACALLCVLRNVGIPRSRVFVRVGCRCGTSLAPWL
jgi:hypothetical protein